MATAELAVAMPVLATLLVLCLSALVTAMDQVRCIDAARSTARALARGDDRGSAVAAGRALAPRGAVLSTSYGTTTVEVQVSARAAPALRWLGPDVAPSARAVAATEGTPGPDPAGAPLAGTGPAVASPLGPGPGPGP